MLNNYFHLVFVDLIIFSASKCSFCRSKFSFFPFMALKIINLIDIQSLLSQMLIQGDDSTKQ